MAPKLYIPIRYRPLTETEKGELIASLLAHKDVDELCRLIDRKVIHGPVAQWLMTIYGARRRP